MVKVWRRGLWEEIASDPENPTFPTDAAMAISPYTTMDFVNNVLEFLSYATLSDQLPSKIYILPFKTETTGLH